MTAAQYRRFARTCLRDARRWLTMRPPPTMLGTESAALLSAMGHLMACALIVEAEQYRNAARAVRP